MSPDCSQRVIAGLERTPEADFIASIFNTSERAIPLDCIGLFNGTGGWRQHRGHDMTDTQCTHSLELMEDEAQAIVTQGVRWVQYDPEHKHRYKCSGCGLLAYRYPRHKRWSLFYCSHTTMQTQEDGSEKRRSACSAVAREWHSESPYCTTHKPIPRGMAEETERLSAAKRADARAERVYAESITRMRRDLVEAEQRPLPEPIKVDLSIEPLPSSMLL